MFDDTEVGAVEDAANAFFFNHGLCCVAGSRLFVQEDRFDEVVNGVAEIAKGIKLGPAWKQERRWVRWSPRSRWRGSPGSLSPA